MGDVQRLWVMGWNELVDEISYGYGAGKLKGCLITFPQNGVCMELLRFIIRVFGRHEYS